MSQLLRRVLFNGLACLLAGVPSSCGDSSSWTPLVISTEPETLTFGATDLKVIGARFALGATIFWNGQACQTTFLSETALQTTLDPAATQLDGEAVVAVVNPESLPSNGLKVAVSKPALEAISPISVPAGYPAFTLTLSGTGFTSATQVTWNGSALQTQFGSSTSLAAQVPAALVGAAGSSVVAIVTPVSCARNSTPPCSLTAEASFTIGGTEPGWGLKIVRRGASGLRWSPIHRMLFASSLNDPTSPAQTISALDPLQATIIRSVSEGNPTLLRSSDDGKYLYVVSRPFTAPDRVLRYELPGLTRTSWSFDAGRDGSNNNIGISDVQVAPGSSTTLAIASAAGLVILDDTVARPTSLPGFWRPTSLQWGLDATLLFATTNRGLLSFPVDSAGVTVPTNNPAGASAGLIQYDRITRLIYDNYGNIFDERPYSRYPDFHNFSMSRTPSCLAAPDGMLGKIFFGCVEKPQANVYRLTLLAFDLDRPGPNPIDSFVLNSPASGEYGVELVRWGTNGLAFATSTNLYLYSGLLVH